MEDVIDQRDPVDHHIGEQLILRELLLDIAIAVAQHAKVVHDPGGKPHRGVVEPEAEILRLSLLNGDPARCLVVEIRIALPHPRELPGLQTGVRAAAPEERGRDALIEMQPDHMPGIVARQQ